MSNRRLPTYFVSHGGGPWPWMKAQTHGANDLLEASLQAIPGCIGVRPKAVLVISGHWTERAFTVMSNSAPPMIYDYSGFPPHTYEVRYDAPGAPQVAGRVLELLQGAGIAAALNPERGFDHGTFVPLAVMYPEADVPVLQLSMKSGYDPQAHMEVGQALAPLRGEGVLILGSGLSYHNLRAFGPGAEGASAAFDGWLKVALVTGPVDARRQKLLEWTNAPAARQAHPQEDHLLPLMVAVGAAGNDPGVCFYHEDRFFGGIVVSSFVFGID